MYRIGIDVGGTFTDFTLLDESERRASAFTRCRRRPHDPSEAIERGIADLLRRTAIAPRDVRHVGHGTTVATNLVIERRGALTGLITTQGLSRRARDRPPDAAAPLRLQRGEAAAAGRAASTASRSASASNAAGEVLAPLDEAEVERAVAATLQARRACARSRSASCTPTAIPDHERRARAVIERLMPEAYVSVSSEVLPEFREFERLSTTVLNAAVGPRMERYLDRFLERVKALGIGSRAVHRSIRTAGLMSVRAVRSFPVRTCLSGSGGGRRRRGRDRPRGRVSRTSSPSTSAAPAPTSRSSIAASRSSARIARSPTIRSRRRWSTST